jgi:molybdenum cofactor cytidylyltransferase
MGRLKQLLPFGDRSVLQQVVIQALAADLGPVVVVLGHRAAEVRAHLGELPVHAVENRDFPLGMLSSVQVGVRAALNLLGEAGAGFLVCLGDQPEVGAPVLRRVGEALRGGAGIVVPVYAGRRGHPLGVARRYAEEILSLDAGAVGLRELLRRHPDEVRELPVDEASILEDLDTPEQYARAMERKG